MVSKSIGKRDVLTSSVLGSALILYKYKKPIQGTLSLLFSHHLLDFVLTSNHKFQSNYCNDEAHSESPSSVLCCNCCNFASCNCGEERHNYLWTVRLSDEWKIHPLSGRFRRLEYAFRITMQHAHFSHQLKRRMVDSVDLDRRELRQVLRPYCSQLYIPENLRNLFYPYYLVVVVSARTFTLLSPPISS